MIAQYHNLKVSGDSDLYISEYVNQRIRLPSLKKETSERGDRGA